MRNGPNLETGLVNQVVDALRKRLPEEWSVGPAEWQPRLDLPEGLGRPVTPDALIRVSGPAGETGQILIEVKSRTTSRVVTDIAAMANNLARGQRLLLAAPWISRSIRPGLKRLGIGYFDPTGNIYLRSATPAFFIEGTGSDRDPQPRPSGLTSLRGQGAGRAVQAVCEFKPPFGIRELSTRARVPAPTISRVVTLLEREGALEREDDGTVSAASPRRIIERWIQEYGLLKSNRWQGFIAPRGLDDLRGRLSEARFDYAATGSWAVPDEVRVAPAPLALIYVRDVMSAAAALDLEPTDTGVNAMLLQSVDRHPASRSNGKPAVLCVSLPRAAADLLTAPGRGPSEGRALLEWMEGNQDAWRR